MAIQHARVLGALGQRFFCVGRSPQGVAKFTEQTGLPAQSGGVESWCHQKNRPEIRTAVVAVPVTQLSSVAGTLLRAGVKKILLEKPAGLNLKEIRKLHREAVRARASVFVAYNRRFFASTEAARRWIREDGGPVSFFFDFTEIPERVVRPERSRKILQNWFLANSSHVVDLAFHLGGRPKIIRAQAKGRLPWHPAGAVFAGTGKTETGALFAFLADWTSPGNWALEVRTVRRRLIFQPLEKLKVQTRGNSQICEVPPDQLDQHFKPGLYRQMRAFLGNHPRQTALQPLAEHLRAVQEDFLPLLGKRSG